MNNYKIFDLTKKIKADIIRDDNIAIDSLLTLYGCQTNDEQFNNTSEIPNGIGFNAADAYHLSKLAKKYISNGVLEEHNIITLKKSLIKYNKQLVLLIIGKKKYLPIKNRKNYTKSKYYHHCILSVDFFTPIEKRGSFEFTCKLTDLGLLNEVYPDILHIQLSNGEFGGIYHLSNLIKSSINKNIKYAEYINYLNLKKITIFK